MRTYIECAEEFMNFYDFNGMNARNGQTQNGVGNGVGNGAQNGTQNRNGEQCNNESFEQKFASYAQKSEEELTAQLLDVARRMKEQGSFDQSALENLYNTAYPMLGEMQRQRMRSIIDMLKG